MTESLAHAHENLVANFRTITVLTIPDDATGAILPSLDEVGRWLLEFNAAFVEANEAVNEGRLHAFVGRRLVLAGDQLLPEFAAVARLFSVASQCGIACMLSVSLDGLERHPLALASLRSTHPAINVQVDCSAFTDDLPAERRAAYASALRQLAQSGVELNLVGAIEALREAGLTRSDEFNRCGFSVSAAPSASIRPVHRLHRVSPCRDYIGLYIDPNDDVYPCAGMIGHESARLGSLRMPFRELLAALAQTRASIDRLAPAGPRIVEPVDRFPVDLCALHRRAVDSLAAL